MIGLANGNPGALTALLELEKICTSKEINSCFSFLNNHKLRGSNLYLIWNDLCGRDTEKLKRYLLESSFNDDVSYGSFNELPKFI